jgi:WD40 repeat protein
MSKWLRILVITAILVSGLAACSSKPTAPAGEQPAAPAGEQPAAPAAEQPAQPAAGQPAAPAAEQPAAGQPAAPAANANQIALPNGSVVDRPTNVVTIDNVRTLDALGVWQLGGPVTRLFFSPDGNTVFAAIGKRQASSKGELYRWNLNDPKGPQLMLTTSGSINAMFFSPDKKYLVYGTQGNELIFYDLAADKPGQNLMNGGRGVTAAAVSPTENLLVWGLFEDYAYYQYLNGSTGGKFGYRLGTTNAMEFSPDGKEVFMARDDGSLFVVDASGWQLLKSIPIGDAGKERLGWLGLSPNGAQLAVTGMDQGTFWVVDSSSWEPILTLQTQVGLNTGAFTPDGQMVLVGNNNNGLTVVTLNRANFDSVVKLADSAILSVAVSPDGTIVLIGDASGKIRMLQAPGLINMEALPGSATATP